MTVGMASGVANTSLDSIFGTTYVQLHTADPGAAGTTSVSVGDATRKQATMASAASGSKAMSSMAASWTNGGTSETLSHISLWTASSAGTFNLSGALTASRAWTSGQLFALTSLAVAYSPIAA